MKFPSNSESRIFIFHKVHFHSLYKTHPLFKHLSVGNNHTYQSDVEKNAHRSTACFTENAGCVSVSYLLEQRATLCVSQNPSLLTYSRGGQESDVGRQAAVREKSCPCLFWLPGAACFPWLMHTPHPHPRGAASSHLSLILGSHHLF